MNSYGIIQNIIEELHSYNKCPPPRAVWLDIVTRLDNATKTIRKHLDVEPVSSSNPSKDYRFQQIARIKERLLQATNIESSPEEMRAIDYILFRFWQMGWLDIIEKYEKSKNKNNGIINEQ